MQAKELLRALAASGTDRTALAKAVLRQPGLVQPLIENVTHPQARVRFGAARVLERIAEDAPALLYPHFAFFVRLLGGENRILCWEATRILAHLVAVERDGQFEGAFRQFFAPLSGPTMITAANIIQSAPVIARARPEWAERMARQILRVETAHYKTPECRNVAIGHAIKALGQLFPLLQKPRSVIEFVRRHTGNSRAATRKKAELFLARHFAH